MIVYHHAFDINNCAFRILQILEHINIDSVEKERMRIWDFYLTFPNEARKIRFPQDLIQLKQVFKEIEINPYENLISPKRMLDQMEPYQSSALKSLASHGLIESDGLTQGVVKRTSKEIPTGLKEKLLELSLEKENVLKLVIGFNELPLYGHVGLKARTGLIEFRYDPK